MSRKSKIDPALKVELVERYLEGEISAKEAGRLAGGARRYAGLLLYRNYEALIIQLSPRNGPGTAHRLAFDIAFAIISLSKML